MELNCQGMRAIITAAASGIGRVVAETLLENGAQVHICDVVEERLAECRKKMPAIGTTLADVSDPAQVDRSGTMHAWLGLPSAHAWRIESRYPNDR